jgi:NAD(P)H-flavin reductase
MMRFVALHLVDRGVAPDRIQVSLERNMQCAIAHCGHCQLAGSFVCADGPVVTWEAAEPLLEVREL